DVLNASDILHVDGIVFTNAVTQRPVLEEAAEHEGLILLLNDVVRASIRAAVHHGSAIGFELNRAVEMEVVRKILGEHLNIQGNVADRGVSTGTGNRIRRTIAVVAA